ncbi:gamma subclass chorismate mutase AroQ [Streptomyces sp. NPDC001407]|uniref:gamma subclass chorismate mutase AroQ n=2 Tax=Streptomyces TaxID=1883 RepID=UPI0036921B41
MPVPSGGRGRRAGALRRAAAALALLCWGVGSLMACASGHHDDAGSARPSTAAGASPTAEQAARALVRLAAERIATADSVAAAKWGTEQPVDDPVAEKAVLDAMDTRAARLGVDREVVRRVFEDQIEAGKAVQRALHERWEEDSELLPALRPDLAKQVDPVLDRLGGQLLEAIRGAEPLLAGPRCETVLDRDKALTARAAGLDAVHGDGLDRALAHTCASS